MGGVRLTHPTQRSCVFVVETEQLFPVPYACPLCTRMEIRKSIHLRLDDQGDVIVAMPVYKALRQVGFGGLTVRNEVPKPPRLYLGAVASPKQLIVDHRLNGAKNVGDKYVPPRTQYESRDRMVSKIRVPKLRLGRVKGRGRG